MRRLAAVVLVLSSAGCASMQNTRGMRDSSEAIVPSDRTPSPTTQPAVLTRKRFGDVIQDGVGYGGVRIGMTSDELSRAWGPTAVVARSTEHTVRLFRLDTGESIVATLKHDIVESLQFIDSRRPGEAPLRTSLGVEMGDLLDRVRSVYGDPEQDNAIFFYYFAEGIGFGRDCPRKGLHDPRRISCVLVFQKTPGFGPASIHNRVVGEHPHQGGARRMGRMVEGNDKVRPHRCLRIMRSANHTLDRTAVRMRSLRPVNGEG